ncbi:MAG: hypothetical protein ACOYJG_08990 [Prevotella sp.]|jgi:hypothetical protein
MSRLTNHYFQIADLKVKITFQPSQRNSISLIPSFNVFACEPVVDNELFFQLDVDDDLRPIPKEQRSLIRDFDTGNGNIIVSQLNDGGYQYIIKDINGYSCALLISDKDFSHCRCALNGNYDMRAYGLNSVLMLAFAFAGAKKDVLLIHASVVRHRGWGYPFIAKSGTGKSTQVSSWLRYIPDCDLMNDDNPIIRILTDGKPYIYGSPWSGKTPCYRNVKAPLGAVTRIDRAKKNSVERLQPVEAFASFLPSCSSMKWDVDIYRKICDTVTRVVETTPIYTLHCLPDKQAAIICNKTIAR